jgi:GDP-D-mannose dehydratase
MEEQPTLPNLQQIAKTKINLGNETEKRDWGNAWLAVGQTMKEAADKGETLSIKQLVKRSIEKVKTIIENQKQLPNGTDPGNDIKAISGPETPTT